MTQATSRYDDIFIIEKLKNICKFSFHLESQVCTEISFHDEKTFFGGTIRHHPQKKHILDLISNLENLKKLNLKKCKTKQLPKFKTKNLESLDISCNNL